MFDCFVSLGPACPIASSMSKYGLRSFSGPFDWLITSDFSWVLYHIDTSFKEFLLYENLEPIKEDILYENLEPIEKDIIYENLKSIYEDTCPNWFYDKQSNIIFLHDSEDFRKEYAALKRKYDRRIDRFLEISKRRVCYLRRISNEEEMIYIENHAEYIHNVLCKYNPNSEIIFVCDEALPVPDKFHFKFFKMKEKYSQASRNALRTYFDYAEDFLLFCGENYSSASLIKNLMFDYKTELPGIILLERRYKTLTSLIVHDFQKDTFSDKVIIYGAGAIGIELYQRIKNLTKVRCFIDRDKAGGEFDNIEIISVDDLKYESGIKIIVSAAYDLENIKSELCDKYHDKDIISLDSILGLKF